MEKIKTVDAVGHVLCHDITQIVKDKVKRVAFKKGHIIRQEDIEPLLALGKEHLYVWEKKEGLLHEDEAADILSRICMGCNIERKGPSEGKYDLFASAGGLFCVDEKKLTQLNALNNLVIASRHNYVPVKKGDKLAGTRVVPLVIEEKALQEAEDLTENRPIMNILPYKPLKVGLVTTGSEVFYKRIKDTFTPVIIEKIAGYGLNLTKHIQVPDDKEKIIAAIRQLKDAGVECILLTGGMSVDPDDMTPGAIKESGAEIVTYGAPVLPGSMFLMAYLGEIPVMGLPGCVMYAKITIFDIILPRVAAGLKITKPDIAKLGLGGLCLGCQPCIYPDCGFGKGY